MRRLCRRPIFRLERLRGQAHIPLVKVRSGEPDHVKSFVGSDDIGRLDRYDPCEIDPPEPMQIFTRLGLLLMIALAFGLAAELLVRLPPH
jgi:hypothetical protein